MTRTEKPFFRRYSDAWMYDLNKAYFNNLNQKKFRPITKFIGQFQTNEAEKVFGYAYLNSKDSLFNVLIPTYIDEEGPNRRTTSLTLNQALRFIEHHKNHRVSKQNEFFILPLADDESAHWTVLKVNLSANDTITAEHYDSSFIHNKKLAQKVRQKVMNILKVEPVRPFLVSQCDSVNCGPISRNVIKKLARGDKPAILPQTGIHYREKDFKLLEETRKIDLKRKPEQPQHFVHSPEAVDNEDEFKIPFWIKHRRLIIGGVVVVAAIAAVSLLILFPPAILIPVVAAGVAATSFSTIMLAGLGAAAVASFVALSAGLIKGVEGMISLFKTKAPPRIFRYDEGKFQIEKYIALPDNSNADDVLQMESISASEISSPSSDLSEKSDVTQNSTDANNPAKKSLSEEDFEILEDVFKPKKP